MFSTCETYNVVSKNFRLFCTCNYLYYDINADSNNGVLWLNVPYFSTIFLNDRQLMSRLFCDDVYDILRYFAQFLIKSYCSILFFATVKLYILTRLLFLKYIFPKYSQSGKSKNLEYIGSKCATKNVCLNSIIPQH